MIRVPFADLDPLAPAPVEKPMPEQCVQEGIRRVNWQAKYLGEFRPNIWETVSIPPPAAPEPDPPLVLGFRPFFDFEIRRAIQ